MTVSVADSVPRRPFLIMSPRRSTDEGSPTTQKSIALAGSGQLLDDLDRAVDGGPFFVGGDEQRDRSGGRRVIGDEALHRGDERRERRLHVGRAATVEPAVALGRHERIGFPSFARTGRHDVGVPGKADERTRRAAPRPQIGDAVRNERFATEAERRETCGDQRLAARVVGRHRGARDQFARERERRIN